MLLNDTALNGNRKIRIKEHFSFCDNRKKAKGGVGTVISNHLKPHTVKVAEATEDEDEQFIISRFDHVIPPIKL